MGLFNLHVTYLVVCRAQELPDLSAFKRAVAKAGDPAGFLVVAVAQWPARELAFTKPGDSLADMIEFCETWGKRDRADKLQYNCHFYKVEMSTLKVP